MSLAAQLIHRGTIQRPTTITDGRGRTKPTDWPAVATVRCRLVSKQQTVVVSDVAERAVVTRYTLLVGPGADIRQGDRLTIRDAAGTVIGDRFQVSAILRRSGRGRHHISCELERIP